MNINQLDKLSVKELESIYLLLKSFNVLTKSVKKTVLNNLKEKIEKKKLKERCFKK